MPAGYERLRDALKRKGKSDEEAKSMAAAIWNSKHKDDPVMNKKHELALSVEQLKYLHELGLATQITPGGMLGNTYVKGYQGDDTKGAQTGHGKTAYKQGKKKIKYAAKALFPGGKPIFNFEAQRFGVILLGLESDFFRRAEQTLADKLGKKIAKNSLVSPQVKTALPMPVEKYPSNPNPNPNASGPGPDLKSILAHLKDRNKRSVLLPRSQGGRGWFPERGDIRDFAAKLVDTKL